MSFLPITTHKCLWFLKNITNDTLPNNQLATMKKSGHGVDPNK